MDRENILRIIEHIERFADVHDRKFSGRVEHAQCQSRFNQTIDRLKCELAASEAHSDRTRQTNVQGNR